MPGYPPATDSFKRQFERDKDELVEMGVPILVETVPGSDRRGAGYRIRPADYELRDSRPRARRAGGPQPRRGGRLQGGMGQRGSFKLGGAATPGAPAAEIPADPDLVAAFTGVAERRRLRFTYRDVARTVDPYRLEFARGRWYLKGFDHARSAERWYRMGRIEGAVQLEGDRDAFAAPAEPVTGLRLEPWVLGEPSDPVRAEVWFDPEVAPTVRAEIGDVEVVADDAAGLVVALTVTNREGFRSWLLSFLDRAEVRSPPDLRSEVVAWLEAVARG
ncbi:MAG: WYL domain-containing protein [Acidimicrobiales bacterium]